MYRQLISFNSKTAGKQAGMCFADTRLGFGIKAKYPDAWTGWMHTQKHTEPIPAGLDVPVYFTYKSEHDGHVGVRLANGKFWSEGTTYADIAAYEKNHDPRYVGWGESINDVKVIDYVADPVPVATSNDTWIGKTVTLHPNISSWAYYKPGTPLPVNRRNRSGELNPKKWGGLSYHIEAVPAPNTVQVTSPSLGTIWLFVDGDATIN